MGKLKIYDAFETKDQANRAAADMRKNGFTMIVKKIKPQDSGRLKWGIFTDAPELV